MNHQNLSITPFQSLISFCKAKDSFRVKLALLSTFMVFSKAFDVILLFIEYMQLISQGLLLNPSFQNPIPTESSIYGFNFFSIIVCIFSPGVCKDYRTLSDSLLIAFVIVLMLITFAKYLLFLYVCFIAKKDSPGNTFLLKIWNFIFKTQSRAGYYFLTSFSANILANLYQNKLDLGVSINMGLETLCNITILMEFILALGSQTLFVYRLPVKNNFFSSKDNNIDIITLIQKFAIQILSRSSVFRTLAVEWAFTSINTIFSLIRMIYLYKVLPYYKIKTLYIYVVYLTIVSCLNIAYSMDTLVRSIDGMNSIDENFGIVTWAIITVIAIGLAVKYLDHVLLGLIMNERGGVSEILVHKVIALKHMLKNSHNPAEFTTKVRWEYLLITSIGSNSQHFFNNAEGNLEDLFKDKTSKMDLRRALACTLESLSAKKPKSSYLKIYLAYYYGKKLNQFGLSMQLLTQLKRGLLSNNVALNAALLMRELKLDITSYHSQSKHIDLALYMQSITAIAELKENMITQAQLQIQLCEQLNASTADLPAIWTTTKKINTISLTTKRQAKGLLKAAPKSYIEPLALYAYYSLVLNHSISKYQKYSKEYEMYRRKHDSAFNSNKLSENNAYQQGNSLFVLSGKKEDISTIVYCSQSAQRKYGRKLIGQRASSLVIPSLQNDHYQTLKSILEKGDLKAMETSTRVFMYMQEGYMELYDYYLSISPFMNQGLYYFMITRKVPTTKEYIVFNADRSISCCTKDLAFRLGLIQKQTAQKMKVPKAEEIWKEFGQVINSASTAAAMTENQKEEMEVSFSDMDEHLKTTSRPLYTGKKTSLDIREIRRLPTEGEKMPSIMYSYEGKTLTLKSLNAPYNSYSYHCKVETQLHCSANLTVISLEKIDQGTIKATDDNRSTVEQQEMRTRHEGMLRTLTLKGGDAAGAQTQVKQDDLDVHSTASYASGPLKQIKISKIFTEATKTRYYSPFYRVFLLLWYLLFAGIIADQIILSSKRASQLDSLNLKKAIMKSAHNQADSLITLHLYLKCLWGIMGDDDDAGVDPEDVYEIAMSEVESLKMDVKNMMIATGSLKAGDRIDIFFDVDVRIFDSQDTGGLRRMNSFHAMNQLLEEFAESLTEAKESEFSEASDPDLADGPVIVFRNDLDDALKKNDEIAEAFFQGAISSNKGLHHTLAINIALTSSCVVFVAGVFIYLVSNHYKNETKNLLSFTNLDKRGVEIVQNRVLEFKKNLQSDLDCKYLLDIDLLHYYDNVDPRNVNRAAHKVKQNPGTSVSAAEYKGTAKKFYVYAFITIPLFTIIIAAILTSHLLFDRSITTSQDKLSKVVFADDLKLNVTLMLTAVSDIVIGGDDSDTETYILNYPLSTDTIQDLDNLPDLIADAPDQLKEENGKYDPAVEDILFRDSCLYLEDELRNECITNQATQKTGIIRVLYDVEQYVKNTIDSIENDSTLPDLKSIFSQYVLVRAIFESLSTQLDDSFDKSIDDSTQENQVVTGVIIASLLVICIGAHITVLKRLGESDNEFKSSLRTFPATLVLGNFLIKSFLVKSSKGSMLSIKGSA